ncbi:MAG: hypothetical protein HY787_23560 [Deltaproteobacteria bacterium]|nr:hypothetical protein [Deltaproteobacteria bacterium]
MFFKTFKIKANAVLFFLVDDTLSEKTGKKTLDADGLKIMPKDGKCLWPSMGPFGLAL